MKKLLLIVAVGFLFGCAGVPIDFDKARTVEVGMTQAQLETIMGRPYSIRSYPDRQVWLWVNANGMTGSHASVTFIVQNGKVVGTPTIPDSFK